jgi:hypothetical protein
LTVDEGDNFTCLCEAKGGNPTPQVIWDKDGVPERTVEYTRVLVKVTLFSVVNQLE